MGQEFPLQIDSIANGYAYGDMAAAMLNNGFNANALRTNGVLRKDEWKAMDDKILEIASRRMPVTNALIRRGLTVNIPNGLGTTIFEYEDASDLTVAEMDMDAATMGKEDRLKFSLKSLPLPIVHKGFRISARILEASRTRGLPLDTTTTSASMRQVAEFVETITCNGAGTYEFGGATSIIYGLLDHPNLNAVTLAQNWDASGKTGAEILADVIGLKQALITDRAHGPYMLIVPTSYETALDGDFKANSDSTVRERLLEIGGIEEIVVADFMTTNKVVLVQMAEETFRMVIGMQPRVIQWQVPGTLVSHYKVITIMVPQLRADQDGRMGLAVLSA